MGVDYYSIVYIGYKLNFEEHLLFLENIIEISKKDLDSVTQLIGEQILSKKMNAYSHSSIINKFLTVVFDNKINFVSAEPYYDADSTDRIYLLTFKINENYGIFDFKINIDSFMEQLKKIKSNTEIITKIKLCLPDHLRNSDPVLSHIQNTS